MKLHQRGHANLEPVMRLLYAVAVGGAIFLGLGTWFIVRVIRALLRRHKRGAVKKDGAA